MDPSKPADRTLPSTTNLDAGSNSPPWNEWPRQLPAVEDALRRLLVTGDWGRYDGQECEQLRQEIGSYFGRCYVYLCSSGTLGVELALRGLAIGPGDEVILAGYDFPGNFRAVEAVGAFPVLVDLRPGHWTCGVSQLEAGLSPQSTAVIVSHLHGDAAPIEEICRWARIRGLAIVEDACQVPGARIAGRPLGSWGDVGVLSFGGSKLLTAGRGGAVLSADRQVLQRIRVFAERGNDAFALSELQAAVIRPQLQCLDDDTDTRARNVAYLLDRLQQVTCLRSPRQPPDLPAYYKLAWFYVGGPSRQDFVTALRREAGVPVDVGFRGFTRRSSRRCRQATPLTESQRASEQTVLLHHPVLLRSAATIDQLADRIVQLAEQLLGSA